MFIVLNIIVSLFFTFMIAIGIRFRIINFILINFVGLSIALVASIMELFGEEDKYVTLFSMIVLIGVLGLDFLITFSKNTEQKILTLLNTNTSIYLKVDTIVENFKLIGAKSVLEAELNTRAKSDLQNRDHAIETWQHGNIAFIKEDYINALRYYQLSLELVPSSIVHLNLSGVFLRLNKNPKAIEHCDQALQFNPKLIEAWINRSVALERMNKIDQALENINQAGQLNNQFEEIWLIKGNLLFSSGQLHQALNAYEIAIEHQRHFAQAWYGKGLCFNKLGNYKEALSCFDKAIQLNPKHYLAYYCRGNILNRLEKLTLAIASYEKVLKIKPDYEEAWNNQGIALSKSGRLREALKCYEKALKLNPAYFEAWINQGLALESAGFYDRAIYSYQRFIELAPPTMTQLIAKTQQRIQELHAKLYTARPLKSATNAANKKNGQPLQTSEIEMIELYDQIRGIQS